MANRWKSMNPALATLLLDSRLGITMGDALPLPVMEGFPIKSGQVHEWFLAGDFPGNILYFIGGFGF